MDEENNTIDDLYQAYADASERGDNTSIISQAIKAEEQGLAGSDAWNRAAADHELPAGIVATDPAQEYIKDFGKVMTQLGLETAGGINRLMPRDDPSGESSDYYGLIDAPATTFAHALGLSADQDKVNNLVIPKDQFESNDRFKTHMIELEERSRYNAARNISKELADALKYKDEKGFNKIFSILEKEAENNEGLALKLQNFKDGTWELAEYDETGENLIIKQLPKVGQFEDERMLGLDLTLDPYFSESGDLVLPGEGVFGMRDGELAHVGASMSRPLDEMLIYNMPGAEYVAENITDKLAFQGPEMLPPEDTGAGYRHGMMAALVRGIGWPLLKGGYKVGKKGYDLTKGSPAKNVERIEPYLYEGILSNLK